MYCAVLMKDVYGGMDTFLAFGPNFEEDEDS